jgi:hypothetical protein
VQSLPVHRHYSETQRNPDHCHQRQHLHCHPLLPPAPTNRKKKQTCSKCSRMLRNALI